MLPAQLLLIMRFEFPTSFCKFMQVMKLHLFDHLPF